MKLTKYGHACVFVDKNGSRMVIDPGEFTELPDDLNNISAIVLTHKHGDHTYPPHLRKIVSSNPDAKIYAHSESLSEILDVDCQKNTVDVNKEVQIGEFTITFYVFEHAVIWKTAPCMNIAVKIDDFYYYPGDSFHIIEDKVEIAGVPVSGPWLKMSEAIEYARAVNADFIVPTHNGLLNEIGHGMTKMWLQTGLEDTDKTLAVLKNGESKTK